MPVSGSPKLSKNSWESTDSLAVTRDRVAQWVPNLLEALEAAA